MESSDPAVPLPPLSPAEEGRLLSSAALDGWGEDDLLTLLDDSERMLEQSRSSRQADEDNDGDVSSVMTETDLKLLSDCFEHDVFSTSHEKDLTPLNTPVQSGITRTPSSVSLSSGTTAVTYHDRRADCDTSSATSSTMEASEESDDGSRSNASSFTTTNGFVPDLMKHSASTNSASSSCSMFNNEFKDRKSTSAVKSGPGTPILPFTFTPVAHGGNSGTIPSMPMFSGLQAAAMSGWKRLRGDELQLELGARGKGEQQYPILSRPNLTSEFSGARTANSRTNKRTKGEERAMKNREAANRSRIKKKEVLSELQNRADTLSSSLTSSREEIETLHQEIASLREQNSFLRGMISAAGNAKDLPAVVPTSVVRRRGNGHSDCGSGSGPAGSANAVVGAIGTALALVSCVAISAAGFGDGSGGDGRNGVNVRNGGAQGRSGRRMLFSIPDVEDEELPAAGLVDGIRSAFNPELWQRAAFGLLVALCGLLLAFVASEVYRAFAKRAHTRRKGV